MIKYLCNECGHEFRSDDDPDTRVCPTCESTAKDHIMMSLSEPTDQKTVRGEIQTWDA